MATVSSHDWQLAVLLHQRPWRETSALLDFLTVSQGRITLLVRGVRGRKAWKPLLQPFHELYINWRGSGELPQLAQLDSGGQHWPLAGRKLYCGLYMNELLVRLLPRNEAFPEVMSAYQSALQSLVEGCHEGAVLRCFEKQLLVELGYGLLLTHEAGNGARIDPGGWYRYELQSGPERVADSQYKRQMVFPGSSLLALAAEQFDRPGQLADARRLHRTVLKHYLGDRPLRSLELLSA